MTALAQFERLESTGLWRPAPGLQRRNVVVALGKASLVLKDMNENALAHWSLAAVVRRNPGEIPALFAPDAEGGETLEIDEALMVEAIETVRAAIRKRRPRPGQLRLFSLGAVAATVLGLGLFWLPAAVVRHAASVVPAELRAELGARLLTHVVRLSGQPCTTPGGSRVLDRLAARLGVGRLVVVPAAAMPSAHLPGGIIVLDRSLVETPDSPMVTAGYILAEQTRASRNDPFERLLSDAGTLVTLRLLTSGLMPEAVLASHAEKIMTTPPAAVPDTELLLAFAGTGVPARPYAYARDITGETVLTLIEGDPMRGRTPAPLMTDGNWVRLQGICGN